MHSSRCISILLLSHVPDLTIIIAGTNPDYPTYVAIKGTVFDVSGNKAYGPEGSYKGMSRLSSEVQLSVKFQHQIPTPCLPLPTPPVEDEAAARAKLNND